MVTSVTENETLLDTKWLQTLCVVERTLTQIHREWPYVRTLPNAMAMNRDGGR